MIKDGFVKDILSNSLYEFFSLIPLKNIFLKLGRNLKIIRENLNSGGLKRDIYSILISPCLYVPLREELIKIMKKKSTYQYQLNLSMNLWDKLHSSRPNSLDEVLTIQGMIKHDLERSEKLNKLYLSGLAVYLYSYVWLLTSKDVKLSYGLNSLKRAYSLYKKYLKKILNGDYLGPNYSKALYLHVALNIIYRLLIFVEDESALNEIDNNLKFVKMALDWLIRLVNKGEIDLATFYLTFAGFLSNLSRLAYEKGYCYVNMPKIVLKYLNYECEDFFFYDKYAYAHYYAFLLDALGNTALFIQDNVEKVNILRRIAFEFERLVESYKMDPLVHDLVSIFAIRYYHLLGTDRDLEKAKNLLSKIEKESSKALVEALKLVYSDLNEI